MSLILVLLEGRTLPASIIATNGQVIIQQPPDSTGVAPINGFAPFEPTYTGPMSLAAVNGKFVAVGAGPGGGPRVQVWQFTPTGYAKRFDQFAFEPSFSGGVQVALTDWNGDGLPDLVVGAGNGGAPRVRIFTGDTDGNFAPATDFFAYEPSFRGGVFVDGSGADLLLSPGVGGGPRVRKFTNGVQVADQFVTDPSLRTVLSYAYGKIDGSLKLEVLLNPTTLLTLDSGLVLQRTTMLYHPMTALGIGDAVSFDQTNLIGVNANSLVTLDEVFGIPLNQIDYPKDVSVGSYQIPKTVGRVGTPPPIIPLNDSVSVYQDNTGDGTLFSGRSIGGPPGTLTYTATVTDIATGEQLGLSNFHGFAGLVPVVTPGRADAPSADQLPAGQVIRLDRTDDADWAVFTLSQPVDDRVHLGYFDAFEGTWKDLIVGPIIYDPAVVAQLGDSEYDIGRTTAVQRAVVTSLDTDVSVGYEDGVIVQHQQQILSGFGFAKPGDSGSLVFKVIGDTLYATGQLFAGDSLSQAVVTPLSRVLTQAAVTLP